MTKLKRSTSHSEKQLSLICVYSLFLNFQSIGNLRKVMNPSERNISIIHSSKEKLEFCGHLNNIRVYFLRILDVKKKLLFKCLRSKVLNIRKFHISIARIYLCPKSLSHFEIVTFILESNQVRWLFLFCILFILWVPCSFVVEKKRHICILLSTTTNTTYSILTDSWMDAVKKKTNTSFTNKISPCTCGHDTLYTKKSGLFFILFLLSFRTCFREF